MSDCSDVQCGVIYENGEYEPIFCNPTTGECYFADPIMGDDRLIAELSVEEPVEVEFDDIVASLVQGDYGECIGVIYDGESLIKLLADDRAMRFDIGDLNNPISSEFTIDIYGDYDED